MNIKKLVSLSLLNLLISAPTYATAVDEKDIKFMPSTEALMKGEVHVAMDVVSPTKINEKYPDFYYLDSLGFSQESNIKLVISKSAYIVNKPVGFFDHLNTGNEKFIAHILGDQKVKKISENFFAITVPGESAHTYKMKTFFDSDDISTLPNSKVIRAVTQSRKLDVISQSASSTTFRELSQFSKFSVGSVQVSNFIPLKENRTMVLTYTMTGVKKNFANPKVMKENLRLEAEARSEERRVGKECV